MSETGHVINVGNLKKAHDIADAWGATKYKPSNPALAVTAIKTLIDDAEGSLDGVQDKLTPYRTACTAADDAFTGLNQTVRRVERAAKACGLAPSFMEDLAIPARKVKGQRATPKKDDGTPDPNGGGSTPTPPDGNGNGGGPGSGSASQMSRQQRIEHLDEMISLLATQSTYTPNEVDLKVVGLAGLSSNLQVLTDTVSNTLAPLSESRNQRNQVLYSNATNVVNTGRLFKAYVQAAFGLKSPEWNQVKNLKFTPAD